MPPATADWIAPVRIWSAASIRLFIPEPQTLLTVVVGTESGMPALIAAWRAGACFKPAGNTQPI